jgi:hypothetical protein
MEKHTMTDDATPRETTSTNWRKPTAGELLSLQIIAGSLTVMAAEIAGMTDADIIVIGLEMAAMAINAGQFDPAQADLLAGQFLTERIVSYSKAAAEQAAKKQEKE